MKKDLADTNILTAEDQNNFLLRLERTDRELEQLRSKLNSYICEPKTYGLFEQMEELQLRLAELKMKNTEIMSSLRMGRAQLGNRIQQQLQDLKILERGVAEYIAGASNC